MKVTLRNVVSAAVLVWFSTHAPAAALIKRVAPFEGQVSEGFEKVADITSLTNLMEGLASFSGAENTGLTVQDGNFPNAWDQRAFEEQCFLGGLGPRGVPATIEITFDYPVAGFGGAFGHRVHPLFDTTQETEFVFYDDNGKEIGRDKIVIGSLPGSVRLHWKFIRGVKRITYSCVGPMVDALTVRLNSVSYRRHTRAVAAENSVR